MQVGITDGLDHYVGNPDSVAPGSLSSYWSVNGDLSRNSWVGGLSSAGRAMKWGSPTFDAFIQRTIPSTKQFSMSWAMRWDVLDVTHGPTEFLTLLDSSGNRQFGVAMSNLGIMRIMGEGDLQVGAAGTRVLNQNVSYRFNLRADITDPAATTLVLSINGTDDITLAAVDIIDSAEFTLNAVRFRQVGNIGGNPNTYTLDDIVQVSDSVLNLGELECRTYGPSADAGVAWTPLAGSNYANVNNLPFDGDTTYNASSTPGQKDIFDYPNLPNSPDSFFCVSMLTIARKDESGTRTIHPILKTGGVEYPQPDVNLSQTYDHYWNAARLNPNTGLAWTKADWDAMQAGYALVA